MPLNTCLSRILALFLNCLVAGPPFAFSQFSQFSDEGFGETKLLPRLIEEVPGRVCTWNVLSLRSRLQSRKRE